MCELWHVFLVPGAGVVLLLLLAGHAVKFTPLIWLAWILILLAAGADLFLSSHSHPSFIIAAAAKLAVAAAITTLFRHRDGRRLDDSLAPAEVGANSGNRTPRQK